MAPVSDYAFESAIGGDEPAKQRDQILADSTPTPPAPPTTPHPMIQYAQSLMTPQYPQGFNPYAAPQQPAPTGFLGGLNDFAQSAIQPLRNIAADPGAYFFPKDAPAAGSRGTQAPSTQGMWPGAGYTPLPADPNASHETQNAMDNATALFGWTKAGSGGLADVHLPGEVAAGAKAAATDLARPSTVVHALSDESAQIEGGLKNRIGAPASVAGDIAQEGAGPAQTVEQKAAVVNTPAPEPPPSPDRPINLGVNLDKVDAPQPVKDLIEQTAIDNAGFEAQRRGVVSIEETQAAANQIQVDAEKYSHLKPGTAMNAETIKATFDAMVSKGNEVVDLQDKVRAAAAVGVKSDELNLRLILATTEHQSLQRVFAGARAESGRALRIQREISTALADGTGTAYDRAIEAIGGKDRAGGLVDRLQKIWTDPSLDSLGREQATYKFIQNLDSPKFFDRINSLWVNSILSGPVTHAVNITGQAILFQTDIAKKLVAAGVDAATTLGGTVRPREVFFTEPLAQEFGAISGLGDGFKRAVTMLRTGVSPEMMTKFSETGKVDREVNAGILNAPLRMLGAEDQVFYASGYASGLRGAAAHIASREKQGFLSGAWGSRVSDLLQNPTDEMLTAAEAAGKRAGLRTDAGVGKLIQLRDIGPNVSIAGKDLGQFQPLRYVIPFLNTPTLLVKIGAEYSPLGFIGAVKGATGAARSESLAAALMGSTGMAFLASKYAEGNIAGGAPTDPAARDAFYASGKIPYSVKIGNEWVSFNRLEPVATPLKWTAAMLDAAQGAKGQPLDVTAAKMAFALGKSLTDATYLSGFSSLIDAINDPERFGQKFLSGIIGGFVPAVVREGVQANDPIIRQPNGIVEQIESTFPGLNQNVAPKVNVYGQNATRSQGKQGISGVVSPVDFNAAQSDPITEKVNSYNLPEMAGQNGVKDLQVGYVSKEIASYRLNPQEASRYQQYAGQATHNLLEALFADKRPYDDKPFSKLTQVDQIRAIRKTIDDARIVGRAQVADEVIHSAKTPMDVARGADMRISTITARKDRAYFLEGLQTQSKLTGEVKSYLDSHSDKGEPTVNDYLKAAPVVREYLSTPPYVIGNQQEWAQLADAKKVMTQFLKATPPPQGWPQLDWFQSHNPQLGTLIRRYSYDSVVNPKRSQILKANPFVSAFLPN